MDGLKELVLLATLSLCASEGPGAEENDFSAPMDLSYASGIDSGGSVQGLLELSPELNSDLWPSASLVVSGRLRIDLDDELEPGKTHRDSYAPGSRPLALGSTGSMELRDFYLQVRSDSGQARFGKQQIVWGRLDGIKVLDLVNPQDFREFIMDEFDQSRIALWSAYFDYTLGSWRTELALVPDGTGHAIPDSGAWFELAAPRFRYGAMPGSASPPVVTESPGHGLGDTAIGLRASRRFEKLDFSAVAYSGLDPEPLGRITESGTVQRFYERREAFGVSAETALGPIAVRAEYAYQPDRVFNIRNATGLSTAPLNQHRAALGLDWNAPGEVFVNLQFLFDSVDSAPQGLVRPERDRIATVFFRRTFAYETVQASLRWFHSFEQKDDMASLTVAVEMAQNTTLRFSVDSFSGTGDGLFGQFSLKDRLTLGIQHIF